MIREEAPRQPTRRTCANAPFRRRAQSKARFPTTHVRMRARTSSIANVLVNGELALSLALAILCFAPLPLGMRTLVVTSASMAPAIPEGSIVYVRETREPERLAEGDVIAFPVEGEKIVLHRIAAKDDEARLFTTKGDANESPDPLRVPYDSIEGRCLASLPIVGGIAAWIDANKSIALTALVAVNIPLLVLAHVPRTRTGPLRAGRPCVHSLPHKKGDRP